MPTLRELTKALAVNRKAAHQSVHRTAGGLRVLSLIQARNLVPFRELVLPAVPRRGITQAVGRFETKPI
jgi:hypothetical protein